MIFKKDLSALKAKKTDIEIDIHSRPARLNHFCYADVQIIDV
jgi:hypothetical protein